LAEDAARRPPTPVPRRMLRSRQVLLALAIGLVAGALIAARPDPRLLLLVSVVEPVGTLWLNALRMVVVPLVVSLLVVGIASVADPRSVGRLGGRALAVFVLLLSVSAAIGLTLVPALFAGLSIDPATSAALRESAASTAEATSEGLRRMPGFRQWLVDLVPTNPVRAAADGAMLPLVVFSVAFGLAATRIGEPERDALVAFFRAVADSMLVLVGWVLALAPLGVFALALGIATQMGIAAAGAIGYYIAVVALSLVALILALYLVAVLVGRVPLRRFARALLPAQVVGFTSRSSLASLPAQVHGAGAQLGLPAGVSGFVLPLAVSVFKPHGPANWCAVAVFTAHLYGIPIGPAELLTVAVAALLLSFAVPGIPSAGLLLIVPVFTSIGLPVEAIGILIAVDAIPDMFKTTANVTGQFVSGVLVGRFAGPGVRPAPGAVDPGAPESAVAAAG
jgi:proton glutamate symport protein